MCGRFAIVSDIAAMKKEFEFQNKLDFKSNYNISPQSDIPVIVNEELKLLNWGLVPAWAKEKQGRPLINARGETVASKPSFRHAFKTGRCIIPASGFFEWKNKQPYYIKPKGHNYFAFAGIWEHNEHLGTNTVAMITLESEGKMAEIHNRTPLMLTKSGQKKFLEEPVDLLSLNKAKYEYYQVSKEVNSTKHNNPSLIEKDTQMKLGS